MPFSEQEASGDGTLVLGHPAVANATRGLQSLPSPCVCTAAARQRSGWEVQGHIPAWWNTGLGEKCPLYLMGTRIRNQKRRAKYLEDDDFTEPNQPGFKKGK